MTEFEQRALVLLERIAQDTKTTRENISKLCFAMVEEAEKEVPESMRRFANYMHDVHDIKYMYEEHGVTPPPWVLREIERLDDRYRQLLTKMTTGGGAFEQIRREMASDPLNRYDHTAMLPKPEKKDETGKCE